MRLHTLDFTYSNFNSSPFHLRWGSQSTINIHIKKSNINQWLVQSEFLVIRHHSTAPKAMTPQSNPTEIFHAQLDSLRRRYNLRWRQHWPYRWCCFFNRSPTRKLDGMVVYQPHRQWNSGGLHTIIRTRWTLLAMVVLQWLIQKCSIYRQEKKSLTLRFHSVLIVG